MTRADIKKRETIEKDVRQDVKEWFEAQSLSLRQIADNISYQGEFSPVYAAVVMQYISKDHELTTYQRDASTWTFIEALAQTAVEKG